MVYVLPCVRVVCLNSHKHIYITQIEFSQLLLRKVQVLMKALGKCITLAQFRDG